MTLQVDAGRGILNGRRMVGHSGQGLFVASVNGGFTR